jgi:hypothetical protein
MNLHNVVINKKIYLKSIYGMHASGSGIFLSSRSRHVIVACYRNVSALRLLNAHKNIIIIIITNTDSERSRWYHRRNPVTMVNLKRFCDSCNSLHAQSSSSYYPYYRVLYSTRLWNMDSYEQDALIRSIVICTKTLWFQVVLFLFHKKLFIINFPTKRRRSADVFQV